jgi:hypothetical protein
MSGRLAYTLAVIIMTSLYIYNLHRAHELRAQFEAQKVNREDDIKRLEAERIAGQNH